MEANAPRGATAGELLSHLGDIENYPDEHLAPYQEFRFGTNTYYFTPGGLLYRKDPGSEEVGNSVVTISPTRSGGERTPQAISRSTRR